MPCEILINVAESAGRDLVRGQPFVVKDDVDLALSPWAIKEQLPQWIILRLTDRTKEQVEAFLEPLQNVFTFNQIASNAQGRRYAVSVKPGIVSRFGISRAFKQEARDFIVNEHGGVIVSFDPVAGSAVVDIPNPTPPLTFAEIARQFNRLFSETLSRNRFIFAAADVDAVIANGGTIEVTADAVLSRLQDLEA